jgi:hypothetical protein
MYPVFAVAWQVKNKGHPKPETFKIDDFIITRQIQELNHKVCEINEQLNSGQLPCCFCILILEMFSLLWWDHKFLPRDIWWFCSAELLLF